ncbi:MAG: ABC transporter permease [Ruminococcus sp.]
MNNCRKALCILFWLAVWQLAALFMDNQILLVGPWEVLKVLAESLGDPEFWLRILHSWTRIGVGFLSAFLMGLVLGSLSYWKRWIYDLINPPVMLMKTVPVASVVILLLLWAGSQQLSAVISFLVVFPSIYFGTYEGIGQTDGKLLEMAAVFRLPFVKKVWYIYRPFVLPFLESACKSAVGMSWKSGVAAEVIGIPEGAVGERLYMAKIYLNTADLFAWTAVILVLSLISEKAVLWMLKKAGTGKGKK